MVTAAAARVGAAPATGRFLAHPRLERYDPCALLSGLVFLVLASVTWLWLTRNRLLYIYDPADHLNEAVVFGRHSLGYFSVVDRWWAPLVHVLLGLALRLTGDQVELSVAIVNLAFLALLFYATYQLGRTLVSPAAGLIAVAILACYPAIFIHMRHPMLDLPLAALASATLLALLRCRRFEVLWPSLVAGALMGLGALTKQAFPAVVLLPALLSLPRLRSRRALRNAAIAGALALGMALPYYLPRLSFYFSYWLQAQELHASSRGDFGAATQFGFVGVLVGFWHQTSMGLALAWLGALIGFLPRRGRPASLFWWCGLWWCGTLAFATALPLRDTRYLIPALPALALMTAAGLLRLPRPAFTLSLALGFGALQMWAVSFGASWWPAGVPVSNGIHPGEPFQLLTRRFNLIGQPQPDPEGLGVAAGLAALQGRVAVLGDRIVRDALRSQHAATRGAAGVREVVLVSCAEAAGLGSFDYVVVQVGGPLPPSHPAHPSECMPGLSQVSRLTVTNPEFLIGVRELLIFAPSRN